MNNIPDLEKHLRSAMAKVLTDLADALHAQPQSSMGDSRRAPIIFDDARPQGRLTTEWPRLAFEPVPHLDLMDDDMVRRAFVPGPTVYLYTAGSSGLGQLARACQLPIFKLGLSQQSDLLVRQQQLRADNYAGCIKMRKDYVPEDGFDDWEIRQTEARNLHSNSFITATPRALRIQLPKSLSFKSFERELHRGLQHIALYEWIKTADGCRHLAALSLDPSSVKRYTAYQFGSSTRYSLAHEMYICRPRDDIAKVALLIDKIIRHHVLRKPISKSK